MEAAWFSETLVFHRITIKCHKREDSDLNLYRRENPRSRKKLLSKPQTSKMYGFISTTNEMFKDFESELGI
jgi:hypothetical protein